MKASPKDYTEHGCDEPSIDIRLCIDERASGKGFTWIFRTGDSSYDLAHSYFCGASCITLDTKILDLLTELVDDVLEQEAMLPPELKQ